MNSERIATARLPLQATEIPSAPAGRSAPAPDGSRLTVNPWLGGIVALASVAIMIACTTRADKTSMWTSIVLAASATLVGSWSLKRLLGSRDAIVEVALVTFCIAGAVSTFVINDNVSNTGLAYSTTFDDSFYFFNTKSIVTEGLSRVSGWTLFEVILAGYWQLVALFKPVDPVDLLPFNWFLAAVCAAMTVDLVRVVVGGRVLRLRWHLVVTLGQYAYLSVIPFLYRDMLVTAGFVGAVLFAWRARPVAAALCVAITLATRGGHGVLAAFVVVAISFTRTDVFQRRPRAWSLMGLVGLAAASYASGSVSSSFISARAGDEGQGNLMTMVVERQQTWTENFAEAPSSLGARIMGLGPAGYPLRLVSGYFAPVVARSPEYDKDLNTLFLPDTMGGGAKVHGYFRFTFAEWLTLALWPLTAPVLLLGVYRLARGDVRQRMLVWALGVTFMFIMVVSMQERHRVAILAFNPVFAAMALSRDWTASESRAVSALRWATLVGLLAVNTAVITGGV